jgi:hypothetical protein
VPPGDGASEETGTPPDEVPVNVIFGDVIGPVAEAGSRGLATPAPVNVILGEVIVTALAGVAGSGGFAGTPGFANGGLISGVLIAGFCEIPCASAA